MATDQTRFLSVSCENDELLFQLLVLCCCLCATTLTRSAFLFFGPLKKKTTIINYRFGPGFYGEDVFQQPTKEAVADPNAYLQIYCHGDDRAGRASQSYV